MEEFCAQGTIASVASTVARLFGAPLPTEECESPLASVLDARRQTIGTVSLERCLIYCPDALGVHIWNARPDLASAVSNHAALRVPVSSVLPPVTPVCFASMFTGVPPELHGIRKYERPVLKRETLFDALLRAGKKIAIVAVRNSSIDLIFRERKLDYFSEDYDNEVLGRAVDLVNQNHHDLIVAYHQEYDDLLHKTEPFSEECLQAAAHHVASFRTLVETVCSAWRSLPHAILFAPDHGAHVDPATGHGDHGENIPEDMHLYHWYGFGGTQPRHGMPSRA